MWQKSPPFKTKSDTCCKRGGIHNISRPNLLAFSRHRNVFPFCTKRGNRFPVLFTIPKGLIWWLAALYCTLLLAPWFVLFRLYLTRQSIIDRNKNSNNKNELTKEYNQIQSSLKLAEIQINHSIKERGLRLLLFKPTASCSSINTSLQTNVLLEKFFQ